ncbi:MAG: GNAT family N-acetyltransferase [Pseudomonadota bacterium]
MTPTLPVSAPVIETERLTLRGPDARDEAAYLAFFTSDAARFIGGGQRTKRWKAWEYFALDIGHWQIRGFGMWAVCWKGSARALGLVGGFRPEGYPENELAWFLFDEAQGQGVAQEAAIAARNFLYRTLKWRTLVSYIDPANTASIRLAERLGAVLDPAAPKPVDDNPLVYRHPAPEACP